MKSTSQAFSTLRTRCRRVFSGLIRSNRGTVAIETVLVVPLIAMIMVGFTEMYLYMRALSSVEHTAFTLADSIGQMSDVIDSNSTTQANDLGAIWNAATLLAAPNTLTSGGGVVVTSICDSSTYPCGSVARTSGSVVPGTPTIYWQRSAPWNGSGAATKESSSSLLPASWPFRNGDSALVVEVFCTYTPFTYMQLLWPGAPGTQTIYRRIYVMPRAANGGPLSLVSGS